MLRLSPLKALSNKVQLGLRVGEKIEVEREKVREGYSHNKISERRA